MTHEEIIAAVESMTVLELADLVKAMEEKFGVSAAAPVAVVAGGAAAGAAGAQVRPAAQLGLYPHRRVRQHGHLQVRL